MAISDAAEQSKRRNLHQTHAGSAAGRLAGVRLGAVAAHLPSAGAGTRGRPAVSGDESSPTGTAASAVTPAGVDPEVGVILADGRRLAERLAGLEYLRAETKRLLAERCAMTAAVTSPTADVLAEAVVHAVFGDGRP